jgi:hypothetical protein
MRSREDVLDSSAEAARWVADALANARTWFPDLSDEELRRPLEQAFELAGRSVRGEREYHAVFEAELHRAIEERAVLGASGSVLPAQSNGGPRAFPFGIARSTDPVRLPPSIAPVEPPAEEVVERRIEAPTHDVASMPEVRFGEDDPVSTEASLAPEPESPEDDHVAEPQAPMAAFAATETAVPEDDLAADDPAPPARERTRVSIPAIKADELRRHVRTEAPAPRQAPPRDTPRRPAPQRPGKRRALAWRRPVAVSLILLMLAPISVVLAVILSRGGHHGPRTTATVAHRTVTPTPRRPSRTDAIARQHRIAKLTAARRHARALARHRYEAARHRYDAQRAAYKRKVAAARRRSQQQPATVQRAAAPAPRPVSPPPAAPSHSSNGGGGSGGSGEFGIEP